MNISNILAYGIKKELYTRINKFYKGVYNITVSAEAISIRFRYKRRGSIFKDITFYVNTGATYVESMRTDISKSSLYSPRGGIRLSDPQFFDNICKFVRESLCDI